MTLTLGIGRYAAIASHWASCLLLNRKCVDGDQHIERCLEVTEAVLDAVVSWSIELSGTGIYLLKPSMIVGVSDAPTQSEPEEIAVKNPCTTARSVQRQCLD